MFQHFATSFRRAQADPLRRRIWLVYLFLAALNVAAWLLALVLFHSSPAALVLCFWAYGFGLRHAVDADHIAAIDNVTRKLMRENRGPSRWASSFPSAIPRSSSSCRCWWPWEPAM